MPVQRDRSQCRLRHGIADDIRKLEWNGDFTAHRAIIEQAFAAQAAGEGLVLVAEIAGYPVGQVWVRFAPHRAPRFWALRVLPAYQGAGLGSRLLDFGERELSEIGFDQCEIGVERSNSAVQDFYLKRGYVFSYELIEAFRDVTSSGEQCAGIVDQFILRKPLKRRAGSGAPKLQPEPLVQ